MHDFVIPEMRRVTLYGVYDMAANAGCISAGIDHYLAALAVERICR